MMPRIASKRKAHQTARHRVDAATSPARRALRSHVSEIGTLSRWLCVGALRKRVLAALGVDDIMAG
jgi:hypothetical protein